MVEVFVFILGLVLLIGGLVLIHYLKAIILGALIVLVSGLWWFFFEHSHNHYHD